MNYHSFTSPPYMSSLFTRTLSKPALAGITIGLGVGLVAAGTGMFLEASIGTMALLAVSCALMGLVGGLRWTAYPAADAIILEEIQENSVAITAETPLQDIDNKHFSSDIATVVYDSLIDAPFSHTHERSKALAAAHQALLEMDHRKAVLH